MRLKRVALACALLFVLALAWNGLLHLVLLRDANAIVRHLYRADLAETFWLSLLVTAGIVVLFVVGYVRFARRGSIREGVAYGVYFACLTGVLVDLNQYVLYPIPGWLALVWFLGGLIEFSSYGVVLAGLYRLSGGSMTGASPESTDRPGAGAAPVGSRAPTRLSGGV